MSAFDTVIIGAGLNGMTAAATLAKAGRKVLVLERRPLVGGLAVSEEFHPGYRSNGVLHDTTGVRRGVVDALALEKHGLKLSPRLPSMYLPEGGGMVLDHEPSVAANELGRVSKGDAEQYRLYREFLNSIRPVVSKVMNGAPPNVFWPGSADKWSLFTTGLSLRRLGKDTMLEAMRVAPMCVADWLNEWFETDALKAALAMPAVTSSFTGPWSPGTAANLLLFECAAEGSVVGGPRALLSALMLAASEFGVTFRTEAEVESIVIEQGRVTGVRVTDGEEIPITTVGASCDPRKTLLDLVPSRDIPYELENKLRHFRGYGTAAKINLALDCPLEFEGRGQEQFSLVRVADDLDGVEKSFDPVKYDELPERPSLDIFVPTVESPELAPDGHSVVSILAHFVPYRLKGGWTHDARQELADTVVARLGEFAPGLTSRIKGREVLAPPDLEERYGLVEGHLYHGDHTLDQLVLRPTPECARYATPVQGLFLCGGGSHPGGGLTLAPGALAAKAMLGS